MMLGPHYSRELDDGGYLVDIKGDIYPYCKRLFVSASDLAAGFQRKLSKRTRGLWGRKHPT